MSNGSLTLSVLSGRLAVWRLGTGDRAPSPPADAPLWAVVRTADELSVVGPNEAAPAGVAVERGWRALKVAGPLDFALTGVLAGLAQPLAKAGVPVFAISTYDTDYVLIREESLADAIAALQGSGHRIVD